eukprot:SAG31_NODE_439_length_15675_cov_6.578390_6_plen_241_part_00
MSIIQSAKIVPLAITASLASLALIATIQESLMRLPPHVDFVNLEPGLTRTEMNVRCMGHKLVNAVVHVNCHSVIRRTMHWQQIFNLWDVLGVWPSKCGQHRAHPLQSVSVWPSAQFTTNWVICMVMKNFIISILKQLHKVFVVLQLLPLQRDDLFAVWCQLRGMSISRHRRSRQVSFVRLSNFGTSILFRETQFCTGSAAAIVRLATVRTNIETAANFVLWQIIPLLVSALLAQSQTWST